MGTVFFRVPVRRALQGRTIQAARLQDGVALRGSTIDMQSLPRLSQRLEHRRKLLNVGTDPNAEGVVRRVRLETELEFVEAYLTQLLKPRALIVTEHITVRRIAANAAAVDIIEGRSEDFHASLAGDVFQNRQAVVLQVLVTDGVVGVEQKCRGQIRHLEDPQAIGGKMVLDLTHKCDRILEIIEHRNRRDDLEPPSLHRSREARGREPIANDRNAVSDRLHDV